jgi:hypothetical protein
MQTSAQHHVMRHAQSEADEYETCQQARGVPPLITATAAALLIGKIVGAAADDEAHVQRALAPLLEIARLVANTWLPENVKH